MFDFLSILGNVFTITGASLPVIGAILWEKGIKKFYYHWKYRKVKDNNSYILIVGLKKNIVNMKAKIASQAESSLPNLRGLPVQVVELPDNCTIVTPREMIAKLEGLRSNMAKMQKFNVHLFYSGPTVLTAFIGGLFYNKDIIYIYQPDSRTKEYTCWGPIKIRN